MANDRLTFSIQKLDGRLGKDSAELLARAGYEFKVDERVDIAQVQDLEMDLVLSRMNSISEDVMAGYSDLGIVGLDRLEEDGADVITLLPLGIARCSLVLGVGKRFKSYSSPQDLKGKVVATSYPNLARRFLSERNIRAELLVRSGGIESYVRRGIADACIDITSSGNSMTLNRITPHDTLLKSEAYLIASPHLASKKGSERLIENLLFGILSAIRSRDFTYLTMNVPPGYTEGVIGILPSEESPTITPLHSEGWWSISSVVGRDRLADTIRALQEAGARDIISNPLLQIFPNRNDKTIVEMMNKIYG